MEQNKHTTEVDISQSEQELAASHDVLSQKIIEHAKGDTPAQRLATMRGFLNEVDISAAKGIQGSDGEVYKREAIDERLEALFEELSLPESKRTLEEPLKLLPRSEGLRAGFLNLLTNESTAQAMMDALSERYQEKEGSVEREAVPTVVAAVGEQALESVGVEAPVERVAETDEQMLDRFVRESRAELQELYAQHRLAKPQSYEMDSLENQIRNVKEDVNKYSRDLAAIRSRK